MTPHTPILFDLGPLSCGCTDHALEGIYKALGDPPDDSIWAPHHDPYVRDHIEGVTARVIAILRDILGVLLEMAGLAHEARQRLIKADSTPWQRADVAAIIAALGGKDPKTYAVEDWLRVVDALLSHYLPPSAIQTEAEFLAVRAWFAGKIQAEMERRGLPGEDMAPALVAAAPVSRILAGQVARMSVIDAAVLDFAILRAADLVSDIGEATRHRMKQIIIDHEQGAALKRPDASLWNLQSRLLDEFGILNRDWRRIAMTEVARNANEGLLSTLQPGAMVKRVEAYPSACPFCRKIHGQVFTLVDPAKADKDGWTEVWLGKTNVGRSASPRKREGDTLVERGEHEMWWPAAGVQHPHCRGTWQTLPGDIPGTDDEFTLWLDAEIEQFHAQARQDGERGLAARQAKEVGGG